MDEKHKSKMARLVTTVKAQRQADAANEQAQRDQEIAFVNAFTASMQDVVAPAFDEYTKALSEHGWASHRANVEGVAPQGMKLMGMTFVFASKAPASQKAPPALVFRIMPSAADRRAVASYQSPLGGSTVIGTVGVNQITASWIHEQLNTVLEKEGSRLESAADAGLTWRRGAFSGCPG